MAAGALNYETIARFKSIFRCGEWVKCRLSNQSVLARSQTGTLPTDTPRGCVKCMTFFIIVYFKQKFQVRYHQPMDGPSQFVICRQNLNVLLIIKIISGAAALAWDMLLLHDKTKMHIKGMLCTAKKFWKCLPLQTCFIQVCTALPGEKPE